MEQKTQKEFVKSEKIEQLKKKFETDSFKFIDKENESTEQNYFILHKDNVRKALLNLCDMWNKDQKSRNFVKHIIGAFIPVNELNKMFSFSEENIKARKNKCAILGIYVCGIKDVAEMGAKLLVQNAKVNLASEETREQAIKELNEEKSKFPAAVRNGIISYRSDNSDKFVSLDAMVALQIFVSETIMWDEREIVFILNKKRVKSMNSHVSKKNKLSKSQINKVSRANTYNTFKVIDDETAAKLCRIKVELKQKENS